MSRRSQNACSFETAMVVASVGLLLCAGSGMAVPVRAASGPAMPTAQNLHAVRTAEEQEGDGLAELASCLDDVARKLQKIQDQRTAATTPMTHDVMWSLDVLLHQRVDLELGWPIDSVVLQDHLLNLPPPALF